ncbi:uncharacterized protein DS421_17g574890 [Arachis hypogaea]|nr:uncharacterized protein DS421_17g574890 [Arachis hypogaea]
MLFSDIDLEDKVLMEGRIIDSSNPNIDSSSPNEYEHVPAAVKELEVGPTEAEPIALKTRNKPTWIKDFVLN